MKNFEKYENEIKDIGTEFAITKEGKIYECFDVYDDNRCEFCIFHNNKHQCRNKRVNWLYEEYKEPPILDEVEKNYLEGVLKPFKDRNIFIKKRRYDEYEEMYICIDDYVISLPCYEEGTMYQGMKTQYRYTLKELGLFAGEEK